jgi:hypothetical protein
LPVFENQAVQQPSQAAQLNVKSSLSDQRLFNNKTTSVDDPFDEDMTVTMLVNDPDGYEFEMECEDVSEIDVNDEEWDCVDEDIEEYECVAVTDDPPLADEATTTMSEVIAESTSTTTASEESSPTDEPGEDSLNSAAFGINGHWPVAISGVLASSLLLVF